MVPSFSGIVHFSEDSYAFALAGAGTPYPTTAGASISQLLNQVGYVELRGAAGVAGESTLAAIDSTTLSANLEGFTAFGVSLFHQNTNNYVVGNDALKIGYIDTSGVYNVWHLGGADFWNFDVSRYFSLPVVLQPGVGVDESNGTIDLANINRIIAATKVGGNSGSAPWPRLSFYIIGSDGIVLEGGESGNPHSFAELDDLLTESAVAPEIFLNHLVENTTPNSSERTGQFLCLARLTLRPNYFVSSREYVFCLDGERSISIDDTYYELVVEPLSATDYILFDSGSYGSGNRSLAVKISPLAHPDATVIFRDYTLTGPGSFEMRSPAIYNGGLCAKEELVYFSGEANGHTLGAATDLVINCSPGDDLSGLNLILSGSNPLLRLNPDSAGAGAIDLSKIEASGEIDIRNDTSNAVTILLAAGTSYTIANNAGGAITVQVPQITLTFTNIISGSELIGRLSKTSIQVFKQRISGTSYQYSYASAGQVLDFSAYQEGYQAWRRRGYELTAENQSIQVEQRLSTAFVAEV